MDLPYRAEYAKSNRSSCRGCKAPIGKDTLRLATMVQSPAFDGKVPQWYHFACFFGKQRPKTTDDIEHFESLRIGDQNKINEKIKAPGNLILPNKGKKRNAEDAAAKKIALKDFKIEYAKSGRATCRGCEQKIMKEEIRISKKDFETEVGMKYGGQDMWHHLSCFAKLRTQLGYFESADKLPGFKGLTKDDQTEAKNQLPAIKQEDVPEIKKTKTEPLSAEDKEYAEQNKLMYKYRDKLKASLSKSELISLLEYNDQQIPAGVERILDRLSDIMTFGALQPCSICKDGQYVFNKGGYICTGHLTEWTMCNNNEKTPKRKPFRIPEDLKEYDFLSKYKYIPRTRVTKDVNPTVIKKEEDEVDAPPKVERERPSLYNMEFVILGKLQRSKDDIKKDIGKLGGKVVTKISKSVMAVISNKEEVEKMGSRMREVRDNGVHVVTEEFINDAVNNSGKIPELIVQKTICDWGSDPNTRLPPEPSKSSLKSKSKSIYTKSVPSKLTLKVKGGGAVDPDSGLEDVAHVYENGSDKFNAVLGKTDINTKKNSYYKIQLLAADKSQKYWVFRSWGRIGTTIGDNKLENFSSLNEAKLEFCRLYEEKTGNIWDMRHNFSKVPGRMYPIDVDYENENSNLNLDIVDAPSKLPEPIQNLIRLIFDVKLMKKVMLEFELDTEKMPLGKLSKKQIQKAYGILSELHDLINAGETNENRYIDATNRFYTFIPHSFGIDNPPILKTKEAVGQKLDMLDNLMELEIAYNLMKVGSDHTVDSYYQQLNTEIEILHHEHEEFQIIHEYVKNTHAETHSTYELEIVDVFRVKRYGEDKRFKPFKKLPNRKLLWHGSRITNYAGILSKGLRIAPPEAPVTGYMFGKGIYFADMVSKSANYCSTDLDNPMGLLLLCDVALGNMYEKTQAEYITKLPKGKHSTKGVGRTHPDPTIVKTIDKADVPLGKGVPNEAVKSSSLLYNEYIVYDVAQVNVKYLLKVNFKYKY